jgi:predicted nuclease with TOPRIM domain
MRMLPAPRSSPQPPGSPVPPPETPNLDPGLLEWYPHPIHSSYPLAIEVQELRATVGYLKLEATRIIEHRSELQDNYCKIVAEARELRETVKNLAETQKLEELRRRLEANRWKDFENTINTTIEARSSDIIERELQLSRELNDAVRREIAMRWMERIQ